MKVICAFLLLVIVVVMAQDYGGHHKHLEEYVDYQAHPHYNYHYGVHDPKHHDIKDQWETRDGHKTKGSYSLLQPDGRKRIVEYEADKDGVHYNVKFEGHAIHEEPKHHHEESHGHGHESHSSQYHHGTTNYAGEIHGHGHESGGGSSGGGGGGGGGGGDSHGHATSYAQHVIHPVHHHGGHY